MEQTQRDSRVLAIIAGVLLLGAATGLVVDNLSTNVRQTRPTLTAPVPRRVIPWRSAAPAAHAGTLNWPTLVSGVSAPETVHAGGVLRYRVTLRNNGPEPVALRPCPAFEQTLSALAGGGMLQSRHQLDCDAIGTLRPEEEIALEMRMDVPSTFGPGPVNLFWSMEGGVDTQTSLAIVAGSA